MLKYLILQPMFIVGAIGGYTATLNVYAEVLRINIPELLALLISTLITLPITYLIYGQMIKYAIDNATSIMEDTESYVMRCTYAMVIFAILFMGSYMYAPSITTDKGVLIVTIINMILGGCIVVATIDYTLIYVLRISMRSYCRKQRTKIEHITP